MWQFVLALALATVIGLPPGGTFIDDDGNIHEGSIEAVAARHLTRGCNPPQNTRFCPEDSVTRAQMATFLARAVDLPPTPTDHFIDDEWSVHEDSINRLAEAGITRGCNPPDNDRFCPLTEMTRGEMAAMLVRAFNYPPATADRFGDDDDSIFESAIDRLAGAAITLGCNPPDNDRYCPGAAVTRAQMASFLARALELESILPPPRSRPVAEVEPRSAWGARSPRIASMHPHTPKRLTVHHAGTQRGVTGPAQFRGWQNWHMDGQGWGDIAYHVLIGVDGTIYEGRDPAYEGDTGTVYDTTGHFLVVVEGNFDEEKPTADQIASLTRVLAWASHEYDIPPSTISGHRDHAATSCPGARLHSLIESGFLEDEVAELLRNGGVDLIWP